MTDTYNYLRDSAAVHPDMTIRDFVKFLYQAEFGGGHLITDYDAALRWLKAEYESTDEDPHIPVCELISDRVMRINIAAVKGKLKCETLCMMFAVSARRIRGDMDRFIASLGILGEYFSQDEIDDYLKPYIASGCPPVSHSEVYREKYAPAYRVVSTEFLPLLPLFMAIDEREDAIVGIDGRCASGKTTWARLISDIYDCNVFHADDFFLPPEMRTEERLGEIGGNMDRERLYREVLLPTSKKRAAVYRKFFCHDCTFSDNITVPYKNITVVEGSYCLHPEISDVYDIKVFSDTDEDTQARRIEQRDGKDGLEIFKSRWIPMEERYFDCFSIRSGCDMIIRT